MAKKKVTTHKTSTAKKRSGGTAEEKVAAFLKKNPAASGAAISKTTGYAARLSSVTAIPRLPVAKGQQVHQAAAQAVAAERGPVIEEVVRESVRAISLQGKIDPP